MPEPELEAAIDTRVYQLTRQLASTSSPNSSVRGQIAVQFFEKRRRKASGMGMGMGMGWFGGGGGQGKGEDDICWETWRLEITLATPKTETGKEMLCFVM